GQPILICAETHQAVDNLTRHLLQYRQYRLIRYDEPRTVAYDPHKYTIPTQIELLRREKQQSSPNTTTTNKSLFGPPKAKKIHVGVLKPAFKFPFILIDEASQITECNIVIPLVRITNQIVLVGDQKQ
ncbi:unnamed protein product, partial [Rotaria sp. Silwood2]